MAWACCAFAAAHGHLGWTHYARRQWPEAAAAFQRAIELGSARPEFYYLLGLALAYQKDCAGARPWLEKALELDPAAEPARQGLDLCR
jgi:Flp pilus assembly protein TadD